MSDIMFSVAEQVDYVIKVVNEWVLGVQYIK